MPDNHRGMPLNGNHRPTPRLARLMARAQNDLYEFPSDSSVAFTPEETQEYINNYRDGRNTDNGDSSVAFDAAPIQHALRNKNRY